MHNSRQKYNDELERINITDYVRQFILHIAKKEGRSLSASHLGGAMHMKDLLNRPEYTSYKSVRDPKDGFFYWDEQKVDYMLSNLGRGRGYLFYFICNGCGHRVKYLYEYNLCFSPLCRVCCRLRYHTPKRKMQDISRIIRRPYLSSENKHFLVRIAGITHDDIPNECKNETLKN